MITSKIKNLFLFIDFLHSNIEQFNKYNEILKNLNLLDYKRNSLNPRSNFKDKILKDKIQIEIKDNFNIIKQNIIQPIEIKANELNICALENTESLWNWNISEIHEFQSNFETNDLPEINIHKEKYISYRNQTHKNYFALTFFFNHLDETLKELFTYFQENEINEFEAFEAKTIEVDSISEAIEVLIKKDKSNTTYFLKTFDEKTEQSKPPYTTYKSQIENNGFFKVNNVKIYTPELAVILTSKNLTVENIQLRIETKINCSAFLQTYIKAYSEGEQYFENEFKISTNTLYSENAKHYIKNLHLNYYHTQHKAPYEGWIFVKNFYPLILSQNEIESFGFYSGIISKVQELKIKHPQLFIDFDKCTDEKQAIEKVENNNSEHKSIDNRTKKLICEVFTNIDNKGWNYAFETELDFNLFTNLLVRFFEYEPFELPKTIIKLKRNCKTKVAKALGEIHKELSNENKLINDIEYFKIIRVLSPFETIHKDELYKALTR